MGVPEEKSKSKRRIDECILRRRVRLAEENEWTGELSESDGTPLRCAISVTRALEDSGGLWRRLGGACLPSHGYGARPNGSVRPSLMASLQYKRCRMPFTVCVSRL